MAVIDNVIHFDPRDFFCARQCQESIKWCKQQDQMNKTEMHAIEIKGETELYKHFVNSILGRKAA